MATPPSYNRNPILITSEMCFLDVLLDLTGEFSFLSYAYIFAYFMRAAWYSFL